MSVADIEPDIEEELELTRVEVTVPEGASPGSKLEVSVAAGNGEMYAGRGAVRAACVRDLGVDPGVGASCVRACGGAWPPTSAAQHRRTVGPPGVIGVVDLAAPHPQHARDVLPTSP